jgi:hypothetical protein
LKKSFIRLTDLPLLAMTPPVITPLGTTPLAMTSLAITLPVMMLALMLAKGDFDGLTLPALMLPKDHYHGLI